MQEVEMKACFGGSQAVWQHTSSTLNCTMKFGVYLPPQAAKRACPVLYFLSGLTCTEQNFVTKAGAQRYAAEHGVIMIAPDTSPRGEDVADDDAYDLGKGASFYLNATEQPWAAHYQMHDYVVNELIPFVNQHFNTTGVQSISGHSMGGHGALVLALRNPGLFKSVSAFSPIVAPTQVPWGHKAFSEYLGADREAWQEWDACVLVGRFEGERIPLLVDQGDADGFLEEQLQSHRLQAACDAAGHPLTLRMQPGYDHSYYFVASFIGEHIAHHARALLGES